MTWDFFQRYDESWIWRCADRHHVTESTRNFAALDECIADAVHHGYMAVSNGARTGRSAQATKRASSRTSPARQKKKELS